MFAALYKDGEEMEPDSFTYRTVLTAREIVQELYSLDTNEWFLCEIEVPVPGKEQGSVVTLYVKRLTTKAHAFEGINKSRTYRTVAKLEPHGSQSAIDIIVSYRHNAREGAKIAFSEEGLAIALRKTPDATGC